MLKYYVIINCKYLNKTMIEELRTMQDLREFLIYAINKCNSMETHKFNIYDSKTTKELVTLAKASDGYYTIKSVIYGEALM